MRPESPWILASFSAIDLVAGIGLGLAVGMDAPISKTAGMILTTAMVATLFSLYFAYQGMPALLTFLAGELMGIMFCPWISIMYGLIGIFSFSLTAWVSFQAAKIIRRFSTV